MSPVDSLKNPRTPSQTSADVTSDKIAESAGIKTPKNIRKRAHKVKAERSIKKSRCGVNNKTSPPEMSHGLITGISAKVRKKYTEKLQQVNVSSFSINVRVGRNRENANRMSDLRIP